MRLLEELWRQARPDLVVSLVPNFNRALFESLRGAGPAAPFVTVLTDLADYPPHFWIERQDQVLHLRDRQGGGAGAGQDHPRSASSASPA